MPNNAIFRLIPVTSEYRPLSDKPLLGTFDLSTPPFNPGPVFFLGDDGSDVPWVAGECHQLVRISLDQVRVRGDSGCVITVIGGAW